MQRFVFSEYVFLKKSPPTQDTGKIDNRESLDNAECSRIFSYHSDVGLYSALQTGDGAKAQHDGGQRIHFLPEKSAMLENLFPGSFSRVVVCAFFFLVVFSFFLDRTAPRRRRLSRKVVTHLFSKYISGKNNVAGAVFEPSVGATCFAVAADFADDPRGARCAGGGVG